MGDANLCRLCAVQKDAFIGIYDEDGLKLSLQRKIKKCLQIEVCKFEQCMFIVKEAKAK